MKATTIEKGARDPLIARAWG
ncbi:hypothetical protein IL54_3883 [Sphingobium sp. ba1]|nr:hypothetical protein IL54_3883 [Sphingobium sp. ba1]